MFTSAMLSVTGTVALYSLLVAVVVATLCADIVPRVRSSVLVRVGCGVAAGAAAFAVMATLLEVAPTSRHQSLLDALFLLVMQLLFVTVWARVRTRGLERRVVTVTDFDDHRLRASVTVLIAVLLVAFAVHVVAALGDPHWLRAAFLAFAALTAIMGAVTVWLVRRPGARA